MAHINKVSQSIETPEGTLCVDIFKRPDGTFGFEEYRRELEDGRGWYPVGFHESRVFDSEKDALEAAKKSVRWLSEISHSET